MYPILLEWGDFVLPAWHTFYVLAALVAYYSMQALGRKSHPEVDSQDLASLFVVCYIAGYFGARMLSILVEEHFTEGFDVFLRLFSLGPMTFYGGAVAAMIAGTIYTLLKRLPFWSLLDICIPAGLFALAVGRIGCFLNGDDYGIPVADQLNPPFWAVAFPYHEEKLFRYPVQLISTVGVGSFAAYLTFRFQSLQAQKGAGYVGVLAVVFYAVFRFTIEFLRGDPRGSVFSGALSTSQFISLWVVFAVVVVAAGRRWVRASP